jgi:hypothetical protein
MVILYFNIILHVEYFIPFHSHNTSICIILGKLYNFYNNDMFQPTFFTILRWHSHSLSQFSLLLPFHQTCLLLGKVIFF